MKSIFVALFTLCALLCNAWGPTGHRAVGEIASRNLTPAAEKAVAEILGTESLAMCGTWLDFVRSDSTYDFTNIWHYCTIADGKTYTGQNLDKDGKLLFAIEALSDSLRTGAGTPDQQRFWLRALVHLVEDLHQPLHVGNGTDRGGNQVRISFFGESTNLHRLWDSDLIEGEKLSYTELADHLNHFTPEERAAWTAGTLTDWALDSRSQHPAIYRLPENGDVRYDYIFQNQELLYTQLRKGGLRLATVLNGIFGR